MVVLVVVVVLVLLFLERIVVAFAHCGKDEEEEEEGDFMISSLICKLQRDELVSSEFTTSSLLSLSSLLSMPSLLMTLSTRVHILKPLLFMSVFVLDSFDTGTGAGTGIDPDKHAVGGGFLIISSGLMMDRLSSSDLMCSGDPDNLDVDAGGTS